MKKILCPRCGAVNLEKFITFPHCAGCNALLPQDEPVVHIPFWRQPLRVWMWACLLGCATIGVLAVAAFWSTTTSTVEFGQLLIYGQSTRRARLNSRVRCLLTIDAIDTNTGSSLRHFNNVRLRLPTRFDGAFALESINPPPDDESTSGGGHYLSYESLSPESVIQLSLRARQVGRHRLVITVRTDELRSAQYRTTIEVYKDKKSTPVQKFLPPKRKVSLSSTPKKS